MGVLIRSPVGPYGRFRDGRFLMSEVPLYLVKQLALSQVKVVGQGGLYPAHARSLSLTHRHRHRHTHTLSLSLTHTQVKVVGRAGLYPALHEGSNAPAVEHSILVNED